MNCCVASESAGGAAGRRIGGAATFRGDGAALVGICLDAVLDAARDVVVISAGAGGVEASVTAGSGGGVGRSCGVRLRLTLPNRLFNSSAALASNSPSSSSSLLPLVCLPLILPKLGESTHSTLSFSFCLLIGATGAV